MVIEIERHSYTAKEITMSLPDAEVELSESRQVVLVLRLTLDQHSELLYGELLNAEGVGQGRFKSLTTLGALVRGWLERKQDPHLSGSDRTV